MSFTPVNTVNVAIDFGDGPSPIGRLAIRERKIYFEYDRSFIARGLESGLAELVCHMKTGPVIE
ncbi:MAG: hypothetical protein KDA56_01245 [Hyphomonas sp.]|nr:hypothetical protein [Hyphomonas sp.]